MPDLATRPLPKATPETAHFWEGTAAGELRLQSCRSCESTYFPPQPNCPGCGGAVEIIVASGRGTLLSYVISGLAPPGFAPPYVLAVVRLDEGPQLLTNIVGVEATPEDLPLDMLVEVEFEEITPEGKSPMTVPVFRPITSIDNTAESSVAGSPS